ncbi:MAG: MYXO-CTERM sorting domain-containing protein, partial [Polyangiaceae bacterium]|nr:MYXO-CTERM sorting domain-containing protein [Polyangiaceae bacterium]
TTGGSGGATTGGTGGTAGATSGGAGGSAGAATGGSAGAATGGSAGNGGSAGASFGGAGGFVGDGGVEPAPRFKVPDDDSCSCSVPGSPSDGVPNGALAGLLGLGAVILRRRRSS